MAFPRRIVSSSALARPTMGNRRRSVSDSVVAVHDAVVDRCNGPDMDDDFVSDDPLSSLLPPPPEEEASTGWDDIKKGDRLAENGVEVSIHYSMPRYG